jgi:flagellar biogenesis protein FliO
MRAGKQFIRSAPPSQQGTQTTTMLHARWRRVLSTVRSRLSHCFQNPGVTDTKQLRVLARLAVSHAAALSVVEFDTRKFLVGTTAKGQISLLLLDVPQTTARKNSYQTIGRVRSASQKQLKATQ